MKRKEGYIWRGMGTVFTKELTDHLLSARMRVLEWLVVFTAAATLYATLSTIRNTTAEDPFIFLRLFTQSSEPLPSFSTLLSFLVPLIAIGVGFDAINAEHARRTLSRLLSQPLYRDALLTGKFLAGLAALSISLLCLWLLVMGAGLILLGVPPSAEEATRAFLFLIAAIAYGGVWLAVAILCSVVFRATSTSALVALGLWLFLTLLWPMLSPGIAQFFAGVNPAFATDEQTQLLMQWQKNLALLSPTTLFNDAAQTLLSPTTRSLGPIFLSQLQGALLGAPLPLSESVALSWPQFTGLIAAFILLFTLAYIVFQRQEIRA